MSEKKKFFRGIYKDLMSGVSYFIPFVVAGGVILSLAYLFDAGNSAGADFGSGNAISVWLMSVGSTAMGYMLPILAGYIAYSVADKPGLLPGMVAGALASSGGSSFIGAIFGGFAGGYIIKLLKTITKNLPRSFEGVKTLIVFPVVGVILSALAMIVINSVVSPINYVMNSFLQNLSTGNAVLLGIVIGGMVAVDMGGPINKTAYLFSVATLTSASGEAVASVAMASCACAGMTISTSCALATVLFPKKFDQSLKDAGKAAWIMGLSFIAEGSIPFVIMYPKQVLPSIVTGAAVAGGLSALFGITITAPIGGIFTIPLVNNIPIYLLSFVIGTLVSSLMMGFMLKNREAE